MRFAYEWHDDSGNWYRSYGNENWEFNDDGLMRLRFACINDLPIKESDRKYHWVLGRRPDDHPGLSDLGIGRTPRLIDKAVCTLPSLVIRFHLEKNMARLLSVNVGLPRNLTWEGKTVYTAIWKSAVSGRRMVRRNNIDGDGQGDLGGHGGEHRAVFVYQAASYRYWEIRNSGETTLLGGNSAKTSPSTALPTMKSALAIAIGLAARSSR